MAPMRNAGAASALSLLALLGCSSPPPEVPPWQEPQADALLERGRVAWLGACHRCHGDGRAGAPIIGDADAWQPRIAKGIDVLTHHALHGFEGKAGREMPARGGKADLADADVRAAVAFMVQQSR
jgi:cytochrome c5